MVSAIFYQSSTGSNPRSVTLSLPQSSSLFTTTTTTAAASTMQTIIPGKLKLKGVSTDDKKKKKRRTGENRDESEKDSRSQCDSSHRHQQDNTLNHHLYTPRLWIPMSSWPKRKESLSKRRLGLGWTKRRKWLEPHIETELSNWITTYL